MTSLLDGGIASTFASAFGSMFLTAKLYRPNAFTDDGMGGGSGSGFDSGTLIRAQLDEASQAMMAADGYAETDQRILVLASGVDPITTDCEIELPVGGTRWSIASVTQDPARAYYDLRGRKKSGA
jgi:hypothetical protein